MNRLANLALSVGETLVHEGGRLLFGIALGRAKELLGTPQPLGTRQLALNRALQKKAVDGALLSGPRTGKEYAKFTLKKGLPTDKRPRTLAVETQPHSVDDFDYDKLPAIEDLHNRSPVWLARRLFPGPEQEGTVLRGELHHPDGAARVGGILIALPEKSIQIQQERGPVEFYAWGIAKFKGWEITQMPYGQRRELCEGVIAEIRLFNRHLHVVPAMPEGGDPVEFYRAIIHDPRGLPWSEGVVVKYQDSPDQWFKVKANDTLDVKVIRCIEGTGRFAGSLGAMVVEGPTGVESEIGSFQLTNEQRRWIWEHREVLTGQIAEVRALTVNESGAIRAGVFVRFHPSRSEAGLLMYSESSAGGDPEESRSTLFRLKGAAGWRRKVQTGTANSKAFGGLDRGTTRQRFAQYMDSYRHVLVNARRQGRSYFFEPRSGPLRRIAGGKYLRCFDATPRWVETVGAGLPAWRGVAWRLLSRQRLTFLDGQILFLKAHMDRSIDPRFDANVTAAAERLN